MKSTQLKGKGNRPPTSCAANKSDFRKVVEKGQDTHFSYNMTVLIGCSAEVTTRSGEKYEGIFVAYSSTQEIMLEAAHLIPSDNDQSAISTHYDVLIIPSDKLMAMKFENAVLSYATTDFQTDSAISAGRTPIALTKELTPWDGGESVAADDLDLGEVEGGRNGWAPGDMFKKNAEKYGVVSSYDQHLSGYTTSLDKSDQETFKKHEEQALQIAEEIEKNTASAERSVAENGDDEEAKFSAVVRDTRDSVIFNNDSSSAYSILNNNNNNRVNNTSNEISRTDKYVPPSRRNQNANQGPNNAQQPPPPQTTPPINSSSITSSAPPTQNHHMSQPSTGANRKSNYGVQRTFSSSTSNSYYQQDNSSRRGSYDRRGPSSMQGQYGPSSSTHGGDTGNRPGRGGKAPMERRGPPNRDDPVKKELLDFQSNFNLASSSEPNTQNRRPPPQPLVSSGPPAPSPLQSGPNAHGQGRSVAAQNGSSAPSASSSSNVRTTNNLNQKTDKDNKGVSPGPATPMTTSVKGERIEKGQQGQAPLPRNMQQPTAAPEPPMSINRKPNESPEAITPEVCVEEKVGVASPALSEARSNVSDSKSIDSPDSRKPFTFNANAKEFNPTTKSFTQRSPATPPRPPSTPASTPQLIPVAQGHPSYIQMPPTAIYLTPQYPQTISHVANQSLSGATNLQQHRHMNPHRKPGMGVSQRADLSPAIPVQAGPLLAQSSLQNSGPTNHPYAAYGIPPPHGYTQQVRIHGPSLVPMYNAAEVGQDGNPIHMPQLHYIHAGAGGHTATQVTVNVSGQNPIIPGSPHYTQSGGNHAPHQHQIYPFIGLPVVGYNPHGPNPLLNQRNYYEQ